MLDIGYYYLVPLSLIFYLCLTPLTEASSTVFLSVDQSGNGDYETIQEAINAVPSKNMNEVVISIEPGTYEEKVVVPADKPFITLRGSSSSSTVISWNAAGDVYTSSTFTLYASDFVATYLTFQNTYGSDKRAVALMVKGDRAAFYKCNILSSQDTLFDETGRHYYKDCYIKGATDFICGNGASFFEGCHIHSVAQGKGWITAHGRQSSSQKTGFVFVKCTITGVRSTMLGRPWGNYARVVFANSYMSKAILPLGWDEWTGGPSKQSTVYFGEYNNRGPGANMSNRVKWAKILSSREAKLFMNIDFIDGRSWIRPPALTKFRRGL